jgi:hypothetical protein
MVVIGSVVLLLLCWTDFRDKVIRPRGAIRYFVAFAFFMVVNISIYYLLIRLVLGDDPALILMGGSEKTYSGFQLFEPLLLAVMYFGAGAATYRFSDKVSVNIYQEIINVFQSLFRIPGKVRMWIDECIEKSQVKIEQLEETIRRLQQYAVSKGWSKENDDWKDLELELRMTKEQIDELKDINRRLESLEQNPTVSEITGKVSEKIKRWQEKEIVKLKRYLAQFLVTYVKEVSEMERVLEEIGAPPWPGGNNVKFGFIYRSLGISFLFGIAFGPIFHFFLDAPQLLEYAWCGALSLGAFGFVFSFTNAPKQKLQNGLDVVLIGAAAGAIAHSTWFVTRILFLGQGSLSWQKFQENWGQSLIGISFGAVIALVVHLFKRHVRGLLENVLLLYICISGAGAISFVVLQIALKLGEPTWISRSSIAAIGVVVMPAVAFALDIFAPARGTGGPA